MTQEVFPDYVQTILENYLDDILTWAEDNDELIANLTKIFARLREKNIRINPEKCKLGQTEIKFLGHVINKDGISFSQDKLDKVANFRLPQNQKNMKSFLGLASYFRDHIKDFSKIAAPMQQLVNKYKPRSRIDWTEDLKEKFKILQDAVINCPQLNFLQEGQPIFVQCDASDYGIGGYLFQKIPNADGKVEEKPIAFISKTLNKTQLKWSTMEKETFAIFTCLMKWEHHLRDVKFTLMTDHKNITFLNKHPSQKVMRWKLAIQEYDFDIIHIPGKDNIVADGFSRFCLFPEDEDFDNDMDLKISSLNALQRELLEEYKNEIKKVNPNEEQNFSFLAEEIFDFEDYKDPNRKISNKYYDILKKVHNSTVGHTGVETTLQRVNAYITEHKISTEFDKDWTNKRRDIASFIRKCPCCQKMAHLKTPIHTHPFTTASRGLWDRIAIDTIGPLPESAEGHKYILTIIDTFSRFIELIPLKSTLAETAADALIQIIGRYGIPCELQSDNGTQFANKIIEQLTSLLDINHNKIHAYSHEENGIIERVNREIMKHLREIIFDKRIHADWYKFLPFVQRIKNAEIHSATGVSPAMLVFGPKIDLNRGILTNYRTNANEKLSNYISNSLRYQEIALQVALETQDRTNTKHMQNSKK
jgi:transposase InsO family protein